MTTPTAPTEAAAPTTAMEAAAPAAALRQRPRGGHGYQDRRQRICDAHLEASSRRLVSQSGAFLVRINAEIPHAGPLESRVAPTEAFDASLSRAPKSGPARCPCQGAPLAWSAKRQERTLAHLPKADTLEFRLSEPTRDEASLHDLAGPR